MHYMWLLTRLGWYLLGSTTIVGAGYVAVNTNVIKRDEYRAGVLTGCLFGVYSLYNPVPLMKVASVMDMMTLHLFTKAVVGSYSMVSGLLGFVASAAINYVGSLRNPYKLVDFITMGINWLITDPARKRVKELEKLQELYGYNVGLDKSKLTKIELLSIGLEKVDATETAAKAAFVLSTLKIVSPQTAQNIYNQILQTKALNFELSSLISSSTMVMHWGLPVLGSLAGFGIYGGITMSSKMFWGLPVAALIAAFVCRVPPLKDRLPYKVPLWVPPAVMAGVLLPTLLSPAAPLLFVVYHVLSYTAAPIYMVSIGAKLVLTGATLVGEQRVNWAAKSAQGKDAYSKEIKDRQSDLNANIKELAKYKDVAVSAEAKGVLMEFAKFKEHDDPDFLAALAISLVPAAKRVLKAPAAKEIVKARGELQAMGDVIRAWILAVAVGRGDFANALQNGPQPEGRYAAAVASVSNNAKPNYVKAIKDAGLGVSEEQIGKILEGTKPAPGFFGLG